MLQDIKQDIYQVSTEGLLQLYDNTRAKWLSVDRSIFAFSANHVKARGERWLRAAGYLPSNNTGYKIPRNATITSLTIQAKQSGSGTFRIFAIRNGVKIVLHTETLTSTDDFVDDALNVDLNAGDNLSVLLLAGQFDYPIVIVELAWR